MGAPVGRRQWTFLSYSPLMNAPTQALDDQHAEALRQGEQDEVVIPPESGTRHEAGHETQTHHRHGQEA